MSGPRLIFLDTETTSLRDDRRPWEIAMIRREPPDKDGALTMFVSDVDLAEADSASLRVGGFYERHPRHVNENTSANGWTAQLPNGTSSLIEETAAKKVEQWTRGAYLVASNPAFDAATLAAMLKRHNLVPAWNYHLIDVRAMALGYQCGIELATPMRPDVKSDDLARWCGIHPENYERHTAMGDARMVRDWYDAMTGGA